MSMFDRNVKIQINKMKYADLVDKSPKLPFNYQLNPFKVYQARMFMIVLGLGCCVSLLHYDIFWYKTTRGLARWKKRVLSLFPEDNHHGHHAKAHASSHGHDKHDDHSHKASHDSHNTNNDHKNHDSKENSHH